jgi:hypothetical protein
VEIAAHLLRVNRILQGQQQDLLYLEVWLPASGLAGGHQGLHAECTAHSDMPGVHHHPAASNRAA